MENKNVEHPNHYNQGKYEVIDVINDWKMNFNLGNVIKYVARADYKNNAIEDLEKAKFYLQYEIDRRKNEGIVTVNIDKSYISDGLVKVLGDMIKESMKESKKELNWEGN